MVRDMSSDNAQSLKKRGVEVVLADLDDLVVSLIRWTGHMALSVC